MKEQLRCLAGLVYAAAWRSLILVAIITALPIDALGR